MPPTAFPSVLGFAAGYQSMRINKYIGICLSWLLVLGQLSCRSNSQYPPESVAPPATSQPAFVQDKLLSLHAFQQTTDYTCGPACLVTLLRYYGHDGNEMQIAKEAHANADTGTSPQEMAAWLEKHGFKVTWGENGSLDLIRANLARGVPTIVEWIDWGGHWVIAVGYDTRGTPTLDDDILTFADPSDCTDGTVDGLTTFNAERFDSMWFDAFNFGRPMKKIYITAEPRK
jgi:hypothetical protein